MAVNVQIDKTCKSPAEFEPAIAATKYGTFNVVILLVCLPTSWTIQFESTLPSYIIPAAACDLGLTPTQKGLLNSMSFFGMLSTGFISGFLLDTLGRKKILYVGFFLQTVFTLGSCFSNNVAMLSIFKFLGGTMTGGLYVALTAYVLEFHSSEYRGKIQMIYGMTFSIANCIMPLIASVILPLNLDYPLGFMNFRAWNLLILISTANPLISFIVFYFLPETPKFLMSIGKNEEALDVLRYIYKLNTRDLKENYPITSLIEELNLEEAAANKKSWKDYFYMGWQQVAPLFNQQYRFKVLLVCLVHGLFLIGINSLRLYLPQIFQASHEYKVAHNGEATNLCNILEVIKNSSELNDEDTCSVNLENSFDVYLNSTLVSLVITVGYVMAGTLINLFGCKRLLVILSGSTCLTGIGLIWSPNTAITLTLSSLYLTASTVAFDIFMIMLVVIFPTTLRYMAIMTPLKPRMGRIVTLALVVITWVLGIIIGLPSLLYYKTYRDTYSNGEERVICYPEWPDTRNSNESLYEYYFNVIFLVITYLVPILSMTYTYARIGIELWGSQSIGECTQRQMDNIKSKRRVVKMMMVVVMIFAVCWLPYQLYFIIISYYPKITRSEYIQETFLAIYWLAMSNSMYNPIIYCWMNARFRRGFKQFFSCLPFVQVSPGALTRREVLTSKRRSYSGSPEHNRIIRNGTLRMSCNPYTSIAGGRPSPSSSTNTCYSHVPDELVLRRCEMRQLS
ncbi:uncharacterized protein [Euwallacea similis]|uniref:uncharacterized protein isoform X1 n=1 Tax=Euwallacea similis TaxID=1736056 RepID=UPI00344CDF8B